jgi:hypothetical protein
MTDKPNDQPIAEKPAVRIEIHAAPKGEGKHLVAVIAQTNAERFHMQAQLLLRALWT